MKSKLELKEKSGYIRNCQLAYCKIQEPVLKYESKHEKEFSVDIVVDEDCALELAKHFGNKTKAYSKDEFKETFKCDSALDKSFVGKMNTNAQIKGELIADNSSYRPKVYQIVDGKTIDITKDSLVGNGSIGDVYFSIMTNSYGTFYKLHSVLVTTLVPYVAQEVAPFGEVEAGLQPISDEESDLPF